MSRITNYYQLSKKEDFSFILIVSIAYLTAINYFQRPINKLQLITLLICSLAFLLIGIFGFNYCKNKNTLSISLSYLLIQTTLAFTIISLAKSGLILLITMALVSQAAMLLSQKLLFLFCGIILSIIIFPIAQKATLITTITATSVYLAGISFVVVFTQTAVAEKKARIELEKTASKLNFANQQLCQYLVQAEELTLTKERNRLAGELHDSLGHHLTIINLQLEIARSTLKGDNDQPLNAINKAKQMTQVALTDLRQAVVRLRSSPLDGQSLIDALEKLVLQTSNTAIKTELEILGTPQLLSPQAELTIYRTVQEALTNACKYSQATIINVLLDFSLLEKIKLTVKDNGIGTNNLAGGFGLLIIKERVELLGGKLEIDTNITKGFILDLELGL